MFKFVVLASALVLAVSAFPAEVSSGSGYLSTLKDTIKTTASDSIGLVNNIVHSSTGTAKDTVLFGKDMANAGIDGSVAIVSSATGKVANISSTGLGIVNNMMKPVPGVNHLVGAATGVGNAGIAVGTNVALLGIDAAGKVGNTAVNTAASVATNVLSSVDKASDYGTSWGQQFWKWV